VRTNKYLNNLIEQDHRTIKRRCASMAGFKSFANAAITIAGIELTHRIRKGQFSFGRGRRRRGWSRKDECAMALA
jgi:transposase-like protein